MAEVLQSHAMQLDATVVPTAGGTPAVGPARGVGKFRFMQIPFGLPDKP